jgi:hypothetical protein
MNQSNKDGKASAENEEERPLIKENAGGAVDNAVNLAR